MNNGNKMMGWIVAIVAVLALIVGWTYYSGLAEEDVVVDEAMLNEQDAETETFGSEIREDIDTTAARAQARGELLALQARLSASENYEEARTELSEIRIRLAAAYGNASTEVKAEWNELEPEFATLEDRLRSGASGALETLSSLIDRLGADVGTETEAEVQAETE